MNVISRWGLHEKQNSEKVDTLPIVVSFKLWISYKPAPKGRHQEIPVFQAPDHLKRLKDV